MRRIEDWKVGRVEDRKVEWLGRETSVIRRSFTGTRMDADFADDFALRCCSTQFLLTDFREWPPDVPIVEGPAGVGVVGQKVAGI